VLMWVFVRRGGNRLDEKKYLNCCTCTAKRSTRTPAIVYERQQFFYNPGNERGRFLKMYETIFLAVIEK
jgi:hypothetical protein